MKRKKEPVVIKRDFTDTEGSIITVTLEKRGLNDVLEILEDGRCIWLENIYFEYATRETGYWIRRFGTLLVVITETEYMTRYEVMCYQNGCALSDGSSEVELRAQIADPFANVDRKKRRISFLIDLLISAVAAVIGTLISDWGVTVWDFLLHFFIFFVLATLLLSARDIRCVFARKRLLKQFDEKTE